MSLLGSIMLIIIVIAIGFILFPRLDKVYDATHKHLFGDKKKRKTKSK